MKELFPEFYPPKKEEFKALWADAIFVFDTNVLLSLYRFPPKTQAKLLGALKKLKKRLWIPHQVALEFHRRRIEVICAQEKTYKDMLEVLAKFKEQYNKHPFLHDKQTIKAIKKACDEVENELKKLDGSRPKWLIEDNVLESIEKIFEGKIGGAYDEKRLEVLYKDGTERYEKSVPPGYRDTDKDKSDKTKTRKYGDLIIWNQIIDKAKEEKKKIIFVTDEQKEDWWWKEDGGRNIGARYELKKEMMDKAGVAFHMYQSDQFIEHSQEHLKTKIGKDILSEIKKVREELAKDFDGATKTSEASPSGLSADSLSFSDNTASRTDTGATGDAQGGEQSPGVTGPANL